MMLFAGMMACAPAPVDSGPALDVSPTEGSESVNTGLTADVVDHVLEPPDVAAGSIRFQSPIYEIPPYSEVMYCYFGTWTGVDVGVTLVTPYASDFSHHAQINRVNASGTVPADGTWTPCEEVAELDGGNLLRPFGLPDGMAMSLPSGTPWILQSHFINTTADILLVRDTIDAAALPASDVTEWAAPFTFGVAEVEVPPGRVSARVECAWEDDYHLLGLWAHMHDAGSAFSLEMQRDGAWTTVYQTDTWDGAWANDPDFQIYERGAFPVGMGDTFAVTCSWDNQTGASLVYPAEMCNVQGMLYSSTEVVECAVAEPEWSDW